MHTITDETKDFNRSELIATTFANPYNEGTHIGNLWLEKLNANILLTLLNTL